MYHIDDYDENSLKEFIKESSNFKLWLIHKDLIDICKDCEFRHMCVDVNIPTQRKDGSWYQKIECNYNPYIGKWKGETNYRTLEECGVIVNNELYYRDDSKIIDINEEF